MPDQGVSQTTQINRTSFLNDLVILKNTIYNYLPLLKLITQNITTILILKRNEFNFILNPYVQLICKTIAKRWQINTRIAFPSECTLCWWHWLTLSNLPTESQVITKNQPWNVYVVVHSVKKMFVLMISYIFKVQRCVFSFFLDFFHNFFVRFEWPSFTPGYDEASAVTRRRKR